jgi:hypothetical protein
MLIENFIQYFTACEIFESVDCRHYNLLGINLTSLGQEWALHKGEPLDTQLFLGLGNRLYPRVLLLILGFSLAHNLAILHFKVLLLEAACSLGGVAVVDLGTGTNSHFIMRWDFYLGAASSCGPWAGSHPPAFLVLVIARAFGVTGLVHY